MAKMPFSRAEYERRWRRAEAEMTRRGYAAAVVWGRSNQTYDRCGDVLYLTNYYCPECPPDTEAWHAWGYYAVILAPGETPELVTDDADDRIAHLATDRISRSRDPVRDVADRLAARGVDGPVALVGADVLPFKYGRELMAASPGVDWREDDGLIRAVRRVKSPAELDLMRAGGRNAGAALDVMMKALVAGRSERDSVAEAVGTLYRGGSQGSFISANHGDTIDYWCRDPLTGRSADAPAAGDFVRGWMDSTYHGYWFDPGRTAVAGGRATAEQVRLIEDCATIVRGVMDAIRPGARTAAIARVGEDLVARVGGTDGGVSACYAAFAHGIGLYWEPPYIGRATDDGDSEIVAGMTFGVEYFLTREGVGTAGIEENFIVGEAANESLSGLPLVGAW